MILILFFILSYNYECVFFGVNYVYNVQMLTENDQLLQEAERGQVFNGYYEGTLAFKPTYKYNIGSSNYDTSHKVPLIINWI